MAIYHAIIERSGPNDVHNRVTVEAADLNEAKQRLEIRYGTGNVISLWGDAESQKVR